MSRSCSVLILFLAACSLFTLAVSSRLLFDEVENQPQVVTDALPQPTATATAATTLPSGRIPAVTPATAENDDDDDDQAMEPTINPLSGGPGPISGPSATNPINPSGGPNSGPGSNGPLGGPGSSVGPSATTAVGSAEQHEPTLSFFMHDIIGGSHPSARVVTGIIAQTEVNGIPFSKANNNIFPVSGGTPLVNFNNINKLINPNTAPLLTGLNGAQTNTIIQNTGSGNGGNSLNGNNLPFVTAGQLPPGSALQQLMFGTITVVDDQLTEGHELGSAVIGRAQGFYLASSLDGTSQTMALTVLIHGGGHDGGVEDAISLFGVHRSASHVSQIAVVGGTGKYEDAKGYATVETLHNQGDQHITDGVDTIVNFNIYLTI